MEDEKLLRQRFDSRKEKVLQPFAAPFESQPQLSEAEPSSLRPSDTGSTDVAVLLSWASLEAQLGNKQEARKLFRKTSEIEPNNSDVLARWAMFESQDGNNIQARDLFLRAAGISARNKRSSNARLLFQQATESDPSHASSWLKWGRFEEWQGSLEKARDCFHLAARNDPEFYKYWIDFVGRYDGPDRACDVLQTALAANEIYSQHGPIRATWGLLEVQSGNYEKGEEKIREVIIRAQHDNNPVWVSESLSTLADALAEMGREEEAEETFRQALRENPDHGLIRATYAHFLMTVTGAFESAVSEFNEALNVAPDSLDVLRLYEQFGKLRQRSSILSEWIALRQLVLAGSASSEIISRSKELIVLLSTELGCPTEDLTLSTGKFYGLKLDVRQLFNEHPIGPTLPILVAQETNLSREDFIALGNELSRLKLKRSILLLPLEGPLRLRTKKEINYVCGIYDYDIILIDREGLVTLLRAKNPRQAIRQQVLSQVDLKVISPFQPDSPVYDANFFGREKELGEIVERINVISYVVVGGRRIGKTSILRQLQKVRLPAAGFHSCFLDCSPARTEAELVKHATSRILGWFARPLANAPQSFAEVIEALPNDKRIVILLDEVDGLLQNDRSNGYQLLNTFAAFSRSDVCRFILCGERILRAELDNPDSPLFNLASRMFVGRLEFPAVEELVTHSMRSLQIELLNKPEILRNIFEFTSGHPNIVQRLCNRLVLRLNKSRFLQLSPDDVKEVVCDPEFLKTDFLDVYWQRATVLERLSILVMVKDDTARTQNTVLEALAQRGIKVPRMNDLRQALERLVDLRNILSRNRVIAGYEFAVTAFPRVLAQTGYLDNYLSLYKETYINSEFKDIVPREDY